jgi:hypothetical protein
VAEVNAWVVLGVGDWDHPQSIGCSGSSEDRLGFQMDVDIGVVE